MSSTDQLIYTDLRPYALIVGVKRHGGPVEILHQHGSDQLADRDMARLAAEVIDELGPGRVGAFRRPDRVIIPPPPGGAVLPCGCGRMLDLADMRRVRSRIVCPDCAARADR